MLHLGQERSVGVLPGRLGLVAFHARAPDRARIALMQLRQGRLLLLIALEVPVHGAEALLQHRCARGHKPLALAFRHHAHRLIAAGRVKRRDQPAGDQVKQFGLVRRQRLRVGPAARGDDGVMIGQLRIVKDALDAGNGPGQHGRGERGIAFRQVFERLFHRAAHVVGQVAAVGARIGDELAFLIEALRGFERALRRKAQLAAGLTLQSGQVVELGGELALFLGLHARHPRGFAPHLVRDGARSRLTGDALSFLARGIKPHALIIPEIRLYGPVRLGNKAIDLQPAGDQHGQRGRLHPAHGKQRPVAQRKRAAGVHAHQPVGLGTAARALVQGVVAACGPQRGKARPDGLVRHGGNPQAFHGLLAARHFIDVAEDELPLAPGVRRADDGADLAAVHELFDHGKLRAGLGQYLELHTLGQNGQVLRPPAPVALIQLLRLLERHQMPDGPRDHVAPARQASLSARGRAQHPRNIPRHGGLFRHHKDLIHSPGLLRGARWAAPPAGGSSRFPRS